MLKALNTTGTTSVRQCHMRLIFTRKSLYFANFSACFLPMLPSAGQLMSIRRQVFVFLFLRHVWTIGFDLLGSGDGGIPHSNVIRLHEPIRMMPVPSALHWNPKMVANIPVNDGGHLIVSISVVHRCQKHYSLPQCGRLFPGLHCTYGK